MAHGRNDAKAEDHTDRCDHTHEDKDQALLGARDHSHEAANDCNDHSPARTHSGGEVVNGDGSLRHHDEDYTRGKEVGRDGCNHHPKDNLHDEMVVNESDDDRYEEPHLASSNVRNDPWSGYGDCKHQPCIERWNP